MKILDVNLLCNRYLRMLPENHPAPSLPLAEVQSFDSFCSLYLCCFLLNFSFLFFEGLLSQYFASLSFIRNGRCANECVGTSC